MHFGSKGVLSLAFIAAAAISSANLNYNNIVATVSYDGKQLEVAGVKAPVAVRDGQKTLRLHIFLDKSVIEVFADDRVCCTRVLDVGPSESGVELFAVGGRATMRSFQSWRLGSIW